MEKKRAEVREAHQRTMERQQAMADAEAEMEAFRQTVAASTGKGRVKRDSPEVADLAAPAWDTLAENLFDMAVGGTVDPQRAKLAMSLMSLRMPVRQK